ncbi:uncharacterized protein LOC121730682 [Aricia agestis]|uniref:uncharacterized protein LOC121730682 n=1 Tax=Aricia agestis TaxID=91739 RepID=UPI001C205ED3|nr:uncharacterized protein LOC121730682 [Aricia agestis]
MKSFCVLLLFIFIYRASCDDFKEEIFIKPLPPSHLYVNFNFITTLNGDSFEHTYYAPRSLGEVMTRHNVEELHLTLTEGQWRHNQWGYPIADAAPGAELYAWFNPSVEDIDVQWAKLSSTLSGLFCASLNFIQYANTITPRMAMWPSGAVDSKRNITSHLRYSSLPREIVCTENLTPWKKLLPCESSHGFSSLLNSRMIHNTNYHSIGVHMRKICLDNGCSQVGIEIKQTVALVYDFKIINTMDWSLRKLFGQGLPGGCPLATSSKIYIDTSSDSAYPFALNPIPDSTVLSQRGGSETTLAIYNIKPNGTMINIAAKYEAKDKILVGIPPPLTFTRHVLGYGKEFGGIVTEITNNYWAPINIVLLENAPWWLPLQLSSLRINGEAESKVILSQYYSPGRSRQRPYHLELLLKLPPKTTTTISIDFEFVFLKWQEYPPDANHGFYIGSALISANLPTARNYTSLPVSGITYDSTFNASRPWYPIVLRTNGAMVSLPTPDFSMPYNVICLACTVVALAFGPLHNICTKRLILKTLESEPTLKQRILKFFKKKKDYKYVSCSRCKYKLSLQYKPLQKIAGAERIDFLDFLCSHCKNEILRKDEKYIIDAPKHVVSQSNSIKTTPSGAKFPPVTQYERDDNYLISTHSPKKFTKPKTSVPGDSKESVATYDTVEMQEELKSTYSKFKLKESRKEDIYALNQISDNNEKRIEVTLSEKQQEYFRFWFPEKDLDKSVPIRYLKNKSSTEILRDIFEKESFNLAKTTETPNIGEFIGGANWSAKIAEKYATENKLKCFDAKSYETYEQNKNGQFDTSNMNGKHKAVDIAKANVKTKEMDNTKETVRTKEVNNAKESVKNKNKTLTERKLSKKPRSIQNHEKAQKSPVSREKSEITKKRKKEKDKKHTDDEDVRSRKSEEDKKHQKDTHPKESFDNADTNSLKEDTRSMEDLEENYDQELITDIKSDDDNKEIKDQQNNGEGEVDELFTASKKLVESKSKISKKSKEPKGKVSNIDVRDPNISSKTQSLLKDIIKRLEEKENISHDLNPKDVKVSKIDVPDKRGVKKVKKQVKLSDKIKIKDSEYDALQADQEPPKGTTRYALSNQNYIDKGWTKLPTEKTVRKMIRYKMKQPHPEFDWFNRNKHKKQMFYNTGEKLADFEDSEGDHSIEGDGAHSKKGEIVYSKKGEDDHSKKGVGKHSKSKKGEVDHSKIEEEDHAKSKKGEVGHSKKGEGDHILKKGDEDHSKKREVGHFKKREGEHSKKVEGGNSNKMERDHSKKEEGDLPLKKGEGDHSKKGEKDHSKKEKGGHSENGEGDIAKKKNKLYYRNGKVALEHYVPEEENNEKRLVVYSKGETDPSGRHKPSTVLATFDHLGNGVVYDHDGNVRLKYNQTEGVLLDKTLGPVTRWKWHTLNDPPELKDVTNETTLEPKDMNIAKLGKPSEVRKIQDKEIQAIAMQNFIKSKQKKFKPFPIKMKAVKINENFSLKVVDQATIYLNFKDQEVNIRTNVGLVLDQKDIVDTELADIGDVTNSDRVPKTASLAMLQSQRRYVQRLQRQRNERMKLLRLKQSSIDRLYVGVSRPRHKVIKVKVDKVCQCNLLCEDYIIL